MRRFQREWATHSVAVGVELLRELRPCGDPLIEAGLDLRHPLASGLDQRPCVFVCLQGAHLDRNATQVVALASDRLVEVHQLALGCRDSLPQRYAELIVLGGDFEQTRPTERIGPSSAN